ncbi:MAG TPA: hypothetical protein VGB70_05920 [Allosphingosinicella sp.]|jgi:ElaB/YqjD/DUF883 family membrane-anchored ribosome-binding protein
MSTTDNRATTSANNSGAGDTSGNEGGGRLSGVKQSASEAFESARERTSSAYQAAREAAGGAVETVRDTARSAGRRTADGVEANPVAAVVGGLALGALAGALLPKTKGEEKVLGSAGRKVTETARQAIDAAKEAGRSQIDELGLSKDGLQRKLGEFTDKAAGAVRSSAGAATSAVKSNSGAGSDA